MSELAWCEFLRHVAGPGVAVVVGFVASELARYVPRFDGLLPRMKRLVFAGLCFLVPVTASGLGVLTCGWLFSWSQTIWPALVAGAVAFGSGTLVHTRKIRDWRAEIARLHGEISAARFEAHGKDGGG